MGPPATTSATRSPSRARPPWWGRRRIGANQGCGLRLHPLGHQLEPAGQADGHRRGRRRLVRLLGRPLGRHRPGRGVRGHRRRQRRPGLGLRLHPLGHQLEPAGPADGRRRGRQRLTSAARSPSPATPPWWGRSSTVSGANPSGLGLRLRPLGHQLEPAGAACGLRRDAVRPTWATRSPSSETSPWLGRLGRAATAIRRTTPMVPPTSSVARAPVGPSRPS